MEVRKLLEVQATIEGRRVPIDMDDENLNRHYSESKGEFINILDMDLIHLVRSYSKCLNHINTTDKEIIREGLDKILQQVYKTREVLDE
mgnify:FL=1|tara:strand:+ start:318 stop:584 length:267 start_codon:yes stop_codon:yes gene_type:complete